MTPTDSPSPKRTDFTNPWVIAGGLLGFGILLLAVPPLLFLLPVAVVILVVLYFVSAGSMQKARKRARSRLGEGVTSNVQAEFSPGMSGALVLNDWGVVFARLGRGTVDLAWDDLRLVDEPAIAMLAFHTHGGVAFEVDLSQDLYFRAIKLIHEKIPGRTNFDIAPESGESNLLRKLEAAPFRWEGKWGRFAVTQHGLEHHQGTMSWQEVKSVQEFFYSGDETESFWELKFVSDSQSFELRSTWFSDGRQIGNCGYDTIKALMQLRIPERISFVSKAPVPRHRAAEEFNRCWEVTRAAFQLAMQSGRFGKVEHYFRHMLRLVDEYSLEGAVDASPFFREYAELLDRMDRGAEAHPLRVRAVATPGRFDVE